MIQESAADEAHEGTAETIRVEHGPEGTSVELEDVTPWEFLTLLLLSVLAVWLVRARARR